MSDGLVGGCACGAVRYELTKPPLALFACHCTDCQKMTAAAYSLAMPIAVAIQWVEVTTPKVPSISGRVVKGSGLILLAIGIYSLAVLPARCART